MDRTAVEKIAKIMEDYSLEYDDSGQSIVENHDYFRQVAKRIYDEGYRPMPKPPPVLSDEEIKGIESAVFCESHTVGTGFEFKVQKAIAQAQRDADWVYCTGESIEGG